MRSSKILTFILFILINASSIFAINTNNKIFQRDSLRQKFIPILNGVWVLSDYIAAIDQTKSPLLASEKLSGIVGMNINAKINSDSTAVEASWNNHEGFDFQIYFQNGQNKNCLKTNIPDFDGDANFFEIGYQIINKRNYLILYRYNKSKKLLGQTLFTKVSENQLNTNVSSGIQEIINEKIFSGNFFLSNKTNAKIKVNFLKDGTLIGLPSFNNYYVISDFLGGPKPIFDMIIFNTESENSKQFAFKILKDGVYLYNIIGDENAGEVLKLGSLKFKLLRF